MTQSSFEADQASLQPIFRLLEIYRSHDGLRFPGVSVETLTQATEGIDEHIEEIERLQNAVAEAREALAARHRSVIELARQAHAYASLFAHAPVTLGDKDQLETLRAQLAEVQFDEPGRGERKRRPRPKADSSTSAVFAESAAFTESAALPEVEPAVLQTVAGRS
jgi:chromosome condensin MukBEF ATPase and DNA-binding subunit MukB